MNEDIAADLRAETEKWLLRADERLSRCIGDDRFLSNIKAYISDSRYFLERGDLIRAFEAVIWAWAWLEIGEELRRIESLSNTERVDAGDLLS
ncbi:MAG TPA: DUF357 domain-containing protein [Methanothrix sp.]|nr:DUF357 domain-containing protein [Methanothrix sp.]HOK58722.1 DUF357 domain-containing protein [Methanothrix sp.]HOL43894.1 DUF357 domain-containing protein [Methanothrix sp.]HPO88938.1 DUF357 domain-containing protein [Methanothrix sp.]